MQVPIFSQPSRQCCLVWYQKPRRDLFASYFYPSRNHSEIFYYVFHLYLAWDGAAVLARTSLDVVRLIHQPGHRCRAPQMAMKICRRHGYSREKLRVGGVRMAQCKECTVGHTSRDEWEGSES